MALFVFSCYLSWPISLICLIYNSLLYFLRYSLRMRDSISSLSVLQLSVLWSWSLRNRLVLISKLWIPESFFCHLIIFLSYISIKIFEHLLIKGVWVLYFNDGSLNELLCFSYLGVLSIWFDLSFSYFLFCFNILSELLYLLRIDMLFYSTE